MKIKTALILTALLSLTGCGTFGQGIESLSEKITEYFVDYCERPPHIRESLFVFLEGELALKGITLTQVDCPADQLNQPN